MIGEVFNFLLYNLGLRNKMTNKTIKILALLFILIASDILAKDYIISVGKLPLYSESKDKGILITDHFYRYVKEINDISYVLKDGSCYEINKDNIDKELLAFGYKPHR